jgi:plasmid stability protein
MSKFESTRTETGKITVRGIPIEVLQALNQLASFHDRSVEAEARQALRVWVSPQMDQNKREKRATAISRRLHFLQEELETFVQGPKPSPSRFAELMGRNHAEEVESWFAGEEEPSFYDLSTIANLIGCSRNWLVHEEGYPFSSTYSRIPELPKQGVQWLLDGSSNSKLTQLHLIRCMSENGEFAVVKCYSDWCAITYHTPYRFSENIGTGGESALASLFLILEKLYKHWVRSNLVIEGYLLEETLFDSLLNGRRHPLNVIQNGHKNCWWEDIWDIKQIEKHEYWPGWTSLTQRIRRVIETRSYYKDEQRRIQNGVSLKIEQDEKDEIA